MSLRSFGREITPEKMGVTSGEKQTILSHIQGIAYTRSEEDYQRKYEDLCNVMNHQCRQYFMRNWDNIREQWVEGLKSCQMNLCNQTTTLNHSLPNFRLVFPVEAILRNSSRIDVNFVHPRNERRYRMIQETI